MKDRKNNYPTERRKRDTSYSVTAKLLARYGEENLQALWHSKGGYYSTAACLRQETGLWVTGQTIKYLADKYNWVKFIYSDNVPAFYRPVVEGRIPSSHFNHIKYVEVNKND